MSASHGRRKLAGRLCLALAMSALLVGGFFFLPNSGSRAAAKPLHLVRLNIVSDSGLVRIEVTADGSFDDAVVDHFSRGRESVIRVHGARSLLRASYTIDEAVASGVRTVTGERDGEPFVDLIITLGSGASIAQKVNFNRLVIGVASDFARLRRRTAPGSAELAKTRRESPPARPAAAPASSAPEATLAAPAAPGPANAFAGGNTVAAAGSSINVAAPALLTASAQPPTVGTAGRSAHGAEKFQLAHFNPKGFLPIFFQPQNSVLGTSQPSLVSFIPMAIDPPGAKRGVWIPGTTTSEQDEIGGRVLGAGFFRPSFLLGATYDDNFFYRSATGRSLGIFTLAPRLEYEIPGRERAMRIAYETQLRRLSNGNWANGQALDFDSRLDLTPFLRVSLRDHFARSPLDPREYDPAGEVYIVGDTFNRNDVGARIEYSLSERSRIALDAGYNLVRWSQDHIAAAPLFINYDELSSTVSYERDIAEETTGVASFTFANTDTSAPLRPQFDNLNNNRRYAFEIGGRTQVTETSGMAFRVGYERSLFQHAHEGNDFNSLTFDLLFRRDLNQNTNFELAALRKTQVSAFNLEGGNARLVSTGVAARLENSPWEPLKLGLSLNYQRLGFPVAITADSTASGGVFVGDFLGELRTDHLYGFSLEAGYRLSDLLRSRLAYRFARRDSTIPVFTFNRHIVSLIFELGRRNEVRGRPF